MSIAVVLAAYVTSYTREATEAIPSACIGGALFVEGTPDCTGTTLTVVLRAEYVELSSFTADTRDSAGDVIQTGLTMSPSSSILPGQIGTYTATVTDCTSVSDFRITTNCFNIYTGWTAV